MRTRDIRRQGPQKLKKKTKTKQYQLPLYKTNSYRVKSPVQTKTRRDRKHRPPFSNLFVQPTRNWDTLQVLFR